MLEGEYFEVLFPELVENMHYVLVSEKVWSKLKLLYDYYPEFRRTGKSCIELYPKCIKMYSAIYNDKIDYSSEIVR